MVKPHEIGPFLLLQMLAAGQRSQVWRAHDSRSGEQRALKLAALRDEAGCARLRNEARVGTAAIHPRLVRVLDAGEDRAAGSAWLAMECLPGGRAALSLSSFAQLLEALASLHASGIVHADVKPANLLAAHDGSLKLADFGLAGHAGEARAAHGTPRYMAPEQARGAAPGAQSDVFAAGAILFELAARRPAFNGSPFEIVQQVLAARPAWEALGDTPFEPVIRCAMAIDPRERYADAADFLRGFRAVCQRPW
jgi:serine/threonine-protein kinase